MFVQDNHGIKAKRTTSHNLQINAIIERVHKVINYMLRLSRYSDIHKHSLPSFNVYVLKLGTFGLRNQGQGRYEGNVSSEV
jgi:hypothetical protein